MLALTTVFVFVTPAGALVTPPKATPKTGTNTDMTMAGTGPGRAVLGFVPDGTTPFDPVLDGYPTSNPATGFTTKNEGFAGIILGRPTDGSALLSLYCFDLFTSTWNGIGYGLGTWDAATVPNVGFVARILSEYYPFVPSQPAGLASATEQAAAVQAAIWFFSDSYVLNTADPLHDTVAAIVAHIIAEGPLPAPTPPSLTISPTNLSGPSTSAIVGPFTVTSSAGPATVSATGALMFSDAAGTSLILDGTAVPSGTQIWLRSTGPTAAVLQATAEAHVPQQNVYLYDGNTPLVNDAQRLILALDSTLTTTVNATAQFKPVGSLVVQKTISGTAAGSQGQVTIHTVCGGTALSPDLIVASGTPAGTSSRTYNGIPSGSLCTITETANGTELTTNITVNTTGQGQQITIPENDTATATITDDYDFVPGSLTVIKNITGAGAGLQDDVTIHVDCGGGLTRDFTIPAGTAGGSTTETLPNIPANSVCTVTETADGHNSAVSVTVTGGGTVTIPSGSAKLMALTDEYTPNPGSFVVTKTIAGDAAGTQGDVVISVACNGTPLSPDFTIPAGTPAGSVSSPPYTGIPAGSFCSATETVDGHTSTTAAEITGDNGTQIGIPAGGTGTAKITDTYTDISGQLVVNKTITGNGAGQQGPITIHVECPAGTPLPDFTIQPGESSASHVYSGLAPGVQCTVSETENGSVPGVVDVVPTIEQPPPISSTGTVQSTVTDEVTALTGSLTVNKSIEGPAAGQQGQVTIGVFCHGVPVSQTPPFVIGAGATGSPAHTYTGIPNGTLCRIFEIADGRTSTVTVTVTGRFQTQTVTAGTTTSVTITDTYSEIPGTILVPKLISGPAAGRQGDITITATCDGTPLPDIVIPAGTPAGLQQPTFTNVPPGATCIVTETADGSTATVTADVTPTGEQTVTVPAATTVAVPFVDVYSDTPGNLLVTKTIGGDGAGQQGQIEILVDCGQPLNQYAFTIPAGAPAGTVSRSFPDIPAGLTCTITETANGSTDTVAVVVTGSPQSVTITAAGTATATLADDVVAAPPPGGGGGAGSGSEAPEAPIGEITVPVTG
jgi:hypothetical protein